MSKYLKLHFFPEFLKTRRRYFSFFVVLFLLVTANSSTYSQSKITDSIKVGILQSITGTMAISERSLVDATLLAIEEINKKGGIGGKFIKPIIEDGASDWNVFAKKAEKLIVKDKVSSIFGCWTSASRKAVLPIIERGNNLLWYPLQYEGGESSKNIIYTGATPNQQIFPALEWCLKNLGKRFFLIGSDYIFPKEANKLVKNYLKAHGGIVSGEEYIPLGEQNFKNVVKMIAAEQPDVIFNTVNGDSNIGLFLELYSNSSDKSKKVPIMSVSIAEEELRSLGTKLTVGNYGAWTYFQSVTSARNHAFVEAFKKRYGPFRVTSDPIEAAYAQVYLFAEAVKKSSSNSPLQIRDAALALEIETPGGMIKIDPENQHAWKYARIGQVTMEGQFKILFSSPSLIHADPYPKIFFVNGSSTQQQKIAQQEKIDREISSGGNLKTKINILNRLLKSNNSEKISFAVERIHADKLAGKDLLPGYEALLHQKDPLFIQEGLDGVIASDKEGAKYLSELLAASENEHAGIRLRAELAICKLGELAMMSDDVSYLSKLRNAVKILGDDESFKLSPDFQGLKKSVYALEKVSRTNFTSYILQSLNGNFWLKVFVIWVVLFLFVWFFGLRLYPLAIYKCNVFLKENLTYLSFGGIDIGGSVRYLFFVGFFYNSKKVLDAWVGKHLESATKNFMDLDTVKSRSVYIPVPVSIDQVNRPDFTAEDLAGICSKKRWCVLIHGEGGTGKTSLACQIAQWGLDLNDASKLKTNVMIPVLIEPGSGSEIDTIEKFKSLLLGQLNAIIGSNENISIDFLDELLRSGRILVIVDDVSVLGDKDWTLPNNAGFTCSCLIVTSRKKEKLGNIPYSDVQALKVSGERLSSFMDAYLRKRSSRDVFSDTEFFKACEKLTLMVGERGSKSITILFAKMYADQMIGMKATGMTELLPHDIPEMMLHFIDELNRNRMQTMTVFDNRLVQHAAKTIAWACCKEHLHPHIADLQTVYELLGPSAEKLISYLETELKLIQITGVEYNKVKFSLDPLAEYYASFYVVSKYGSDISQWNLLLDKFETFDCLNGQSRGFLMALADTVHAKASQENIPHHITSRLSELTQTPGPGKKKIRVGVLHSMTGSMSISERSLVDAINLAIDEVNSEGGILGKELEAVFEDGASDGEVFFKKARKLILDDGVCSVFGCWTSISRKAVVPVFEEYNNLLWYPIQYEGGESSPNVIYSGATPNQQIIPAIDWCLENIGKRIFLIGSDYIFPRDANQLIKKYLEQFDITVVGEEYLSLGNRDFSTIILKVIQAEADMIFNTVNGDSNMGLFQELASAKRDNTIPPVMSFSIAEDELMSIGANLTEGNYCSWNYFQSILSPENEKFVKAFKNENGSHRVTDDPIESSYMQIKLFAKAVTLANSTDSRAIRNAAKGLEMGAPRGNVKIDPENQHTWKHARIGRINVQGQFDIIWQSSDLIRPEPFMYFESMVGT